MLLVRAIGFHWHALQRDLLALGLRATDMFTPKLTAGELASIVVAAPTGSSLCHVLDGGTLMASLQLQQPDWTRPKPAEPEKNTRKAFKSIAEFEAHRASVIKSRRKETT